MKIKRVFVVLILLFCCNVANSMTFDKLILTLGSDDEKIHKDNYKVCDIFKPKDAVIYNNYIYVLDGNDCFIYYFDMQGNFKGKFGGMGGGPKELYSPENMEMVGEDLWVTDFNNNRIQIYHNHIHKRSIKFRDMSKLARPREIGELDGNIFISSVTISPKITGITVLNEKGVFKRRIMVSSMLFPNTRFTPWFTAKLQVLSNKQLLVGYKYLPIIVLIDKDINKIRYVDMSEYYTKHESKDKVKNKFIVPSGYTATTFSSGPKNTILIAACNNSKRRCNRVMQFSSDLSKKINEIVTDYHIWDMEYYPKKDLIVLITGDREVKFYEIH